MAARYRPLARADILRQFRYYLDEVGQPDLANRFLGAVEAAVDRITDQPGVGAPQSFRHAALQNLRAWPVPGFEIIRLYYEAIDGDVVLVRVLHDQRDVLGLLTEESTE